MENKRIAKLGEGAFSKVFLEQLPTGRYVACKESGNLKLLRQEALYLRQLNNPAFPTYFGYTEQAQTGRLYMEYIRGLRPEEYVKSALNSRGEEEAIDRAIRLTLTAAEALMTLHERATPLIFRDLKPENLLVEESGRLRILDLGLVREEGMCGETAGSPGFAAPEQFEVCAYLSPRTDIYGLGRTLQKLTEQLPADRKLRQLIRWCTEPDPEDRPADMRLVRDLLSLPAKPQAGCFANHKIRLRKSAVLSGDN